MDEVKYGAALLETARRILSVDSPSGFCGDVMDLIADIAARCGFAFERTRKGCGIVTVEGEDASRTVGLTAHVDTLGAMVRSIGDKGELMFTAVGGPILPTLDGEYCRVRTREGTIYTGTFLSKSPAVHVFPDAATRARDEENMYVRLDEPVRKKDDVSALGIMAGDYIFIDPKTQVTPSGFLKSRFIDDKGSVAILMTLLQLLHDEKRVPAHRTKLLISVYEEVGHGASWLPDDITELLAVDMGCIGLDLGCTEYDVSICAKDSGGPYDYEMTSRLVALAKEHKIPFAVDIYPRYGSDVGAARTAGYDIKGALIGPGVAASHGMERTHRDAMLASLRLLCAYLGCPQ